LAWPSSRRMLIARLRSDAMTRGAFPVLTRGLVFLVGDVADPVELVLYVPVAGDPGGEVGGIGLAVAGDEVDDLDGPLALRRDGAAQLRDLGRRTGSRKTIPQTVRNCPYLELCSQAQGHRLSRQR
jgi:hypothetical protein